MSTGNQSLEIISYYNEHDLKRKDRLCALAAWEKLRSRNSSKEQAAHINKMYKAELKRCIKEGIINVIKD